MNIFMVILVREKIPQLAREIIITNKRKRMMKKFIIRYMSKRVIELFCTECCDPNIFPPFMLCVLSIYKRERNRANNDEFRIFLCVDLFNEAQQENEYEDNSYSLIDFFPFSLYEITGDNTAAISRRNTSAASHSSTVYYCLFYPSVFIIFLIQR